MFGWRLRYRRLLLKSFPCANIFVSSNRYNPKYLYLFLVVLSITSVISYRTPFALLFNLKYFSLEYTPPTSIRDSFIEQHKQQQQTAYLWLRTITSRWYEFPQLISKETRQSVFYEYIHSNSNSVDYQLVEPPKKTTLDMNDKIVISILFTPKHLDHRQGTFYIGQIIYQLLKNYDNRFLITLCENHGFNPEVSEEVELIRQILPVFLVHVSKNGSMDTFEQEKQAHLNCILANFESFPQSNYLLLLQDDAEPANDDFYSRLSGLIDQRLKPQWPANGYRKQPGFMKIYHPRWLIDYFHPSFYMLTQLLSLSFLLASIVFGCFFVYDTKHQGKNKHKKQNAIKLNEILSQNAEFLSQVPTVDLLHYLCQSYRYVWQFLYVFLLTLMVVFLLNHTNVAWHWRSLHPSFYSIYPSPSCCLPGVIYFRSTYVQVTNYLKNTRCSKFYAIDTALDNVPERIHLQTYLVEPNLVHHIGLYSRLRQSYVHPYYLD